MQDFVHSRELVMASVLWFPDGFGHLADAAWRVGQSEVGGVG